MIILTILVFFGVTGYFVFRRMLLDEAKEASRRCVSLIINAVDSDSFETKKEIIDWLKALEDIMNNN